MSNITDRRLDGICCEKAWFQVFVHSICQSQLTMKTCQFLLILFLCLVASAFAQGAPSIYRCIVAGKTVYSDQVCGKPGFVEEVEIHHAKGVVSPDRETVADTRARIQDQMWVDEEPGRTKTRTVTRNGVSKTYLVSSTSAPVAIVMPVTVERCSQIEQKLRDLDATARQPQTGQVQDWIKNEKVQVQSQRAAMHC